MSVKAFCLIREWIIQHCCTLGRAKEPSSSITVPDNNTPDLYLYFVMNGNFLFGTVLGADPPESLLGTLERMPYNAITFGKHDVQNAASFALLC